MAEDIKNKHNHATALELLDHSKYQNNLGCIPVIDFHWHFKTVVEL